MHGQGARELVLGGLGPGDVRGDRPEEAVVDQEDEGRGALDHSGLDEPSSRCEGLVAVIAGAGLAADDVASPLGRWIAPR